MKIAIIGENYYPSVGGIQEHIYHQATYLRSMGHDARVVTGLTKVPHWIGPRDEDWVIRVGDSVRFGTMGTYTDLTIGPRVAARMRRLFAEEKFDLVHVHGPNDFGLPLLTYLMYNGPIVATLHSAFKHTVARTVAAPWYRHVLRRSDVVIAVSPLAAATMQRYADFSATIIPNGVQTADFANGQRLKEYDDGRKNIIYLGRLEPRNGPDLLLAALPEIVRAYPTVRLLLAGAGPMDADLRASLSPELRNNVVFLGLVENNARPDIYKSADVFVIPARFGGTFSIMVLEGLAAGVPIVATPFVDKCHRDAHWDPVRMTSDYTPMAIANGIIEALGADNSARVATGLRIVQEYDWARVGERIVGAYESLYHSGRLAMNPAVVPDGQP